MAQGWCSFRAVVWVFLSALHPERPRFTMQINYASSKDKKKPWKPELMLWKKTCQRRSNHADPRLLL